MWFGRNANSSMRTSTLFEDYSHVDGNVCIWDWATLQEADEEEEEEETENVKPKSESYRMSFETLYQNCKFKKN